MEVLPQCKSAGGGHGFAVRRFDMSRAFQAAGAEVRPKPHTRTYPHENGRRPASEMQPARAVAIDRIEAPCSSSLAPRQGAVDAAVNS